MAGPTRKRKFGSEEPADDVAAASESDDGVDVIAFQAQPKKAKLPDETAGADIAVEAAGENEAADVENDVDNMEGDTGKEDTTDKGIAYAEAGAETAPAVAAAGNAPDEESVKRGRGRPSGSVWSDDQDQVLNALVNKHTDKKGKKNWSPIFADFMEQYPGSTKTVKALKCRYEQCLKGADIELNDNEKIIFRRAVDDIERQRVKLEAIAWRFTTLTKNNKPINRTGVSKLLKAMKTWPIPAPPEKQGK